MGLWSKLKSYFKKTSTTTTDSTNGVKLTGGYAGGIEAHRTPSGYVPPPSGSYSGGTSGGTSYSGGGTTAEIIAQQEDISLPTQLEATKQDLTSIQRFEASKDLAKKTGVLEEIGLSKKGAEALAKREFVRREAKRRGRSFTRLELERFLGGGKGISSLRIATSRIKKAGASGKVQEFLKDIPEAVSPEEISTIPPDIEPTEFGVGDVFGITPRIGEMGKIYETYKKGEEKVSGATKKFWSDRISQFEKAIKKNPDLYPEETKENIKQVRKSLETGEGLTKLEQQLIDRPLLTTAELGMASLFSLPILFGGVGTAQQVEEVKKRLIKGGKKIEEVGEFLQEIPDLEILGKAITDNQALRNIGVLTEVTGKGVRGASTLVPETAEDILAFATIEKVLKSKIVPKIAKSVGLKGLSGYEIYSGITTPGLTEEERYGKFLVGGLAGVGAIPEDIVLVRKLRYKLGGVEKTKVGELGIQKTDIDLGKFDIDIEKGVGEITFDPLRLEYIPSRKEVFTGRIDTLKELSGEVNFKDVFKLPKTTKIQSKVLNIVKERGDIISGSFAQKTLIKGSRDFKDLDILSDNPKALAELIKKRLGDEVKIETKKITDSPLGVFEIYKVYDKKGKHIVDLDPIKFAEEGYAGLFNPIKVKGYNILPPEVRLLSKTLQQARALPTGKRAKVITDIATLKGKPELATDPSLLRGYGVSKAKQKAMFDAQELYLTHGGKGIIPAFEKIITLKEGEFFSVPTLAKTGKAGARKSRMGFGKEQEYVSFLDLMNPKERANIEFYPKAKGVVIERGKLKKGKIEIPDISSTEIEVVRKVPKEGTELAIQKRFRTILEGEPVEIAYVKEVPKTKAELKKERLRKKDVTKSKTKKDESDLNEFLKEQEGIRLRKEKKIFRTPQRPKIRKPTKDLRVPQRDLRMDERIPDRDIPRMDERIPDRDIPRTPPRVPPYVPPREPPRSPPRRPSRMPPTEPKLPPRIGRKRMIVSKDKKAPSHDVFVKPPKRKKFLKVTKSPVGLIEARDTRNYFIDETTSRSGYLKPRKVKPSPLQFDIPKNYARDTQRKFRTFKQKKGKRTKLPKERVIERGKFLIDTKGEKQQLDIFKAMARSEKRKQNKNLPVGLQFN